MHELTLEFDGRKQWSCCIGGSWTRQTDGLDDHWRMHLQAERALRMRALAVTCGASVLSLLMEAK
jgi:hypothetical protein